MIDLRKAIKMGKIEQFIRERDKDAPGDLDKLDAALKRPLQGTGKSDQEASKPGSGDD